MARLGLISDTHGTLDPRALKALSDVDAIVHAGDVCARSVLSDLESLGVPVYAVRGNCDPATMPGITLPPRLDLEFAGAHIHVVHQREDADDIGADEADLVVFGHTHAPSCETVDDVIWANPGSASQPRCSPIGPSVAVVDLDGDGTVIVSHVPLSDFGPEPNA